MAKKNHTKHVNTEVSNGRTQIFAIDAPMALSVQLVGDFTRWQQQPISMKKSADGVWQTKIELPPGQHHYRFLVDGEWRDDRECTLREPNPYGGQNSVRRIN